MKREIRSFLVLLCCICLLTGCSNIEKQEMDDVEENTYIPYREEAVLMPNQGIPVSSFCFQESGCLTVWQTGLGLSKSNIKLENWTPLLTPEITEGQSSELSAISEDGDVFLLFYSADEEQSGKWKGIYYPAEGEASVFDMPEGKNFSHIAFDSDGVLYLSDTDGQISMVDTGNGQLTKVFSGAGIWMFSICNELLIAPGRDTVYLYDLSQGKLLTSERVLDEFVTPLSEKNDVVLFCSAEEEGVYLICRYGVYHYNLGSSMLEKVIDGSGLSMESKSGILSGFCQRGDNFYALYRGELVRYLPGNLETESEKRVLRVYSLWENTGFRNMIVRFQNKYPDIRIEYEVGTNDWTYREDAIKRLNIEILSGNGPDIIFLDDLPAQSYIKKGVLSDLTDLVEEIEKETPLLSNVIDPYRTAEGMYQLPTTFTVSVVHGGNEETVRQAETLAGFADTLEELHRKYPEEQLSWMFSPAMLYCYSAPACINSWQKEDGSLDEENLRCYLEQTDRIWQVVYDAMTEGQKTYCALWDQDYLNDPEYKFFMQLDLPYEVNDSNSVLGLGDIGTIAGAYSDYNNIYRKMNKVGGSPVIQLWEGQSGPVFMPKSIVGISSTAKNKEDAAVLIEYLLSDEVQTPETALDYRSYGTTTVNRRVFDSSIPQDCTDQLFTEEQARKYREMLTSVSTPMCDDYTLYFTVQEAAVAYLSGEISLDEAMEQIIRKMDIYLAE